MKKVFVLTFVVFIALCSVTHAEAFESKGRAVVTGMKSFYINSNNYSCSDIFITNVSGCDVTCRVTVYDHAGKDVTKYLYIYTGNDSSCSSIVISHGESDFSLPAGETRTAHLRIMETSRIIVGYAVVEWSCPNHSVEKALIASGERTTVGAKSFSRGGFVVNGDRSF